MKQIHFFLFWIVIGVVLLIELGVATYWWMDEGPETAKKALDVQFKKLTDLNTRAQRTPSGVYDPEKAEDIRRLTQDYLLTVKWKAALQPVVEAYEKQIEAIHKELASRSKLLHQPIAASDDLFAWDEAYKRQSAAVLARLAKANALVLPDNVKVEELETNQALRDVAGLYTKGGVTTKAEDHGQLTLRLRIIERLTDLIEKARAPVLVNPAVATIQAPAEAVGTAIVAVEWNSDRNGVSTSKRLSGATAKYADATPVRLTLQGPASALIAMQAALECLNRPVACVVGGSLGSRGNWKAGDRKDRAFEPMVGKYDVVILDFTKAENLAVATTTDGRSK